MKIEKGFKFRVPTYQEWIAGGWYEDEDGVLLNDEWRDTCLTLGATLEKLRPFTSEEEMNAMLGTCAVVFNIIQAQHTCTRSQYPILGKYYCTTCDRDMEEVK